MQSRDLIISAYTNYDWSKIKYWANSIDRCGFSGDRVVIVYNSDEDTVNRLADLGFKILTFYQDPTTKNFTWNHELVIVVERFYHMWRYLDQLPDHYYRYVISTDSKDVVFQQNPSKWLEDHLGDMDLLASCESIKYQHEPWGYDNIKGSYPLIHQRYLDKPIWNCGVQAGRQQAIKDLWLNLWLLCQGAARPNADQAAYNILLNTSAWSQRTKFSMSEDGWACQAGTTVDPTKIAAFRPYLLEAEPVWQNGRSGTSQGQSHVILHQWDRVPFWYAEIEQKYG